MKIVIDIPDEYKKLLDNGDANGNVQKSILLSVTNGTPLPKGHGDLISRSAVITMLNKIENAVEDGEGYQFNEWVGYVEELPAEEVQPIVHAHWIFVGTKIAKCSNCNMQQDTFYGENYCPNCGARMKGVEE